MSTNLHTEESYEKALIELFHGLGYDYECGYEVERDFCNPIHEKIIATQKHLEEENSRLAFLRDTLLPRLMSGEIKVLDVTI